MDPILLVPIIVAAALGVAAVLWYRKRQAERVGTTLEQSAAGLGNIESSLQSYIRTGDYIPERVRRPLEAKVTEVEQRILPRIAKVVRRVRDASTRNQFEATLRHASQLQQVLKGHNQRYVQRMIAEHSKLLVGELKADEAQREAIDAATGG